MALLLAHHPLCATFANDRFHVRAWGVCSGCAVAGPAMLLGLGVTAYLEAAQAMPALPVMAAALFLGLPQLATYMWRLSRLERGAAKALGGLGIGAVGASWLFLPHPWWAWLAAGGFLVALGALQALRVRSLLRTCDQCPWRRDWDACPGFVQSDVAHGRPRSPVLLLPHGDDPQAGGGDSPAHSDGA